MIAMWLAFFKQGGQQPNNQISFLSTAQAANAFQLEGMAAPQQNNEKRGVRSSKIWLRLKNPKTFFSPKSPTRHIYPNKIRHNFLMGFVAFEVKFDFSVRFGWNTYIYIFNVKFISEAKNIPRLVHCKPARIGEKDATIWISHYNITEFGKWAWKRPACQTPCSPWAAQYDNGVRVLEKLKAIYRSNIGASRNVGKRNPASMVEYHCRSPNLDILKFFSFLIFNENSLGSKESGWLPKCFMHRSRCGTQSPALHWPKLLCYESRFIGESGIEFCRFSVQKDFLYHQQRI